MNRLGIYIHIPFCKRKCKYCDFVSFNCDDEKITRYFDALKKEINNSAIPEKEISSIYIGGGTPSFVDSKYIVETINLVKNKFKISRECEITIEVNPGTVNEEKLEDYIKSGINRLSIGLQSTEEHLLKLIR